MAKVNPDLGKEIADRLNKSTGEERKRIIDSYISILKWSESKLRAVAKEYGFISGRKGRKDKGVSKVKIDAETVKVGAAMVFGSKRLTDKITMPAWKAIEILGDNGKLQEEISPSWFNRQLREKKISGKDIKKATPAISLASRHPNHVHQMDFSVCIQYDFKEKGTRWKMVDRDMQKAFYKNKPGYWKKVRRVLIRALMTDHCSGAFWVKYYYVEGENSNMIIDFMYSAWAKKPDPNTYPFCGVPYILMMDPGSANTGQVITNLLKNLRVKTEVHFPGHARVKGQVECMHGYWEEAFESELSLKKAMDIEKLNTRAYDYAMYLNTIRKHKRHGMTRFAIWNLISQEQLRLPPSRDIYEGLCDYDPVQATIDNRKCIQFDRRIYQVKGAFRAGDKVWVIKNPYKEPFIEISDKKENGEFYAVELIYTDKYGFNVNAAVIGENYKRHEDDETAKFVKAVEKKEISLEGIEPKLQREKIEKIAYIERQGTEIDLGVRNNPPLVQTPRRDVSTGGINTPLAPLVRGEDNPLNPPLLRGNGETRNAQPETVMYPRCDVYKEIRFRMKLERITPLQSQLIDHIVVERQQIEDTVIEEIIRQLRGEKPTPCTDAPPGRLYQEGNCAVSAANVVAG